MCPFTWTRLSHETMKYVSLHWCPTGKPFDTSQPLNYAVSNVISAIIYGSRFEYNDSHYTAMVNRANHNFKLTGSASVQVCNNRMCACILRNMKLQIIITVYHSQLMDLSEWSIIVGQIA